MQDISAEYSALQSGEAVPKSSSLSKLDPVMGEDGMMRTRGRLRHSDLSVDKKPVHHTAQMQFSQAYRQLSAPACSETRWSHHSDFPFERNIWDKKDKDCYRG